MFDFLTFVLTRLLRSWLHGNSKIRSVIVLGILSVVGAGLLAFASDAKLVVPELGRAASGLLILFGGLLLLFPVVRERLTEEERNRARIERVEDQIRQHPDRPQLAWDLARTKLENYLDRNLGQLRSIFWLVICHVGRVRLHLVWFMEGIRRAG
jgi:hypothetical protein